MGGLTAKQHQDRAEEAEKPHRVSPSVQIRSVKEADRRPEPKGAMVTTASPDTPTDGLILASGMPEERRLVKTVLTSFRYRRANGPGA